MKPTFRDRIYKPALLLLAAVLIFVGSFAQKGLNRDRETLGLTRAAVLENAPPALAFTTVALGGFRGLIANALWIRANELQDEGKYFEIVQLADWITKLQPTFTDVWVYHAWNMSYNISIKFTEPQDRWLWVHRGITLLRDDALKYNPGEPLIYRELAWHFQHKIGHYLDDAHNEYKRYWAQEFFPITGPEGRPDFEGLIHPQTPEQTNLVNMLRGKFKMDPTWMQEVDQTYGPLEWRLAETHAIYWAYVGLQKTQQDKLKKDDITMLRRSLFQAMQLAFHRGKLIFPSPESDEFIYGPNLEIVDKASQSYLDMVKWEPQQADNMLRGHRNFVRTAVYFLYTHNRMRQAQEWFTYLKKQYPNDVEANMDLDTYALSRISEDVGETDPNRVKAIIEGLLETAFLRLATGQEEQALGYDLFARKLWNRYTVDVGEKSADRMSLTPLPTIKKQVQDRMLNPEYGLHPVLLAQLRQRLGLPAVDPNATNLPPANLPPSTNAVPARTNTPAVQGAR